MKIIFVTLLFPFLLLSCKPHSPVETELAKISGPTDLPQQDFASIYREPTSTAPAIDMSVPEEILEQTSSSKKSKR